MSWSLLFLCHTDTDMASNYRYMLETDEIRNKVHKDSLYLRESNDKLEKIA
jgi:hypothetical protein